MGLVCGTHRIRSEYDGGAAVRCHVVHSRAVFQQHRHRFRGVVRARLVSRVCVCVCVGIGVDIHRVGDMMNPFADLILIRRVSD